MLRLSPSQQGQVAAKSPGGHEPRQPLRCAPAVVTSQARPPLKSCKSSPEARRKAGASEKDLVWVGKWRKCLLPSQPSRSGVRKADASGRRGRVPPSAESGRPGGVGWRVVAASSGPAWDGCHCSVTAERGCGGNQLGSRHRRRRWGVESTRRCRVNDRARFARNQGRPAAACAAGGSLAAPRSALAARPTP